MKNSIIAYLLISLFISMSNFALGQADDLVIIEKSINVEKLKKYLAKDEAGNPLPIVMVTNKKISTQLEIDFEGERINIFESLKESGLEEDQAFIDLKKFKVRRDVSVLKFNYQGYKIKIKFRKKAGEWIYQSFNLKGNGGRYMHVDATF